MEDESTGCEIQEYSPSGGDGKVMRRIIRRGLRIGKTIIVTGVVISSAPFVLPPLMVVSAIGLACSVPFGVFVASYACAENLMSKLLPMPKPPPPLPLMLEYKGFLQTDEVSYIDLGSEGEIYENEAEEEEDELVVGTEADLHSGIPIQMSEDVKIGGVDMEEEERFLEDTKATVEMRIALPVGEERESVPKEKYYNGKEHNEEQKADEGYQEDDGSYGQKEEQSSAISKNEIPGCEIHPMVEILRQERPVDNMKVDVPNLAQKTHEDITCKVVEVEGPYGLTVGTIEQTTVEKKAGDAHQVEQSMTIDLEGSSEDKRPTSNKEKDDVSQFTAKHRAIKVDDVHNTGVEGRTEMTAVLETAVYAPSEQTMKSLEYELAATMDKKDKQNIIDRPINLELVAETQCPQKENLENQQLATHTSSTAKRKKKPKKTKPKSGDATDRAALDIHPGDQEGSIWLNADARNTAGESRLNVVGDKNKTVEEIYSNKKAAGVVHPNESGTTSRTPAGRNLRASPKKALFSEEKIWENIEALRTIVGYRVARHQTCMEELKALYIFTGVEPPMSFKSSPDARDSSDLVEVNEKLQFLMAIVGVK